MAVLNDTDRAEIWADWMRENHLAVTITKAELRAAFDALDSWLDTNAATINAAIPQPARGALTAKQKARLLQSVIQRRYVRA